MCENLAANGVIDDSEGLRKYLSEVGYASFISAGTYQIPYHASYEEITNILKDRSNGTTAAINRVNEKNTP